MVCASVTYIERPLVTYELSSSHLWLAMSSSYFWPVLQFLMTCILITYGFSPSYLWFVQHLKVTYGLQLRMDCPSVMYELSSSHWCLVLQLFRAFPPVTHGLSSRSYDLSSSFLWLVLQSHMDCPPFTYGQSSSYLWLILQLHLDCSPVICVLASSYVWIVLQSLMYELITYIQKCRH